MRMPFHTRSLAAVVLLMMLGSPALAESQSDRARAAIAAARAKVDIAAKLNAAGETPRLQAEAAAALRTAEEKLASGREREAIEAANRAQTTADTAIGVAERNRTDTAAAQQAEAQAAASSAQQQAADANARAATAEQAAAAAQADAAAARATPPVVLASPQPETTVTTETTRSVPTARSTPRRTTRVVKRKPSARASTVTERTTTTVRN